MTLRTDNLIARLEKANHVERIREMRAQAEAARTDKAAADTLAELAGSDGFYERSLAVLSCYASRDGAMVARFLADPSRLLRGYALKLMPLAGSDEQIVALLPTLLPKVQTILLRRLRAHKRSGAIDRFLETLSTGDDPAALGELLVFGSPDFVRGHLERLVGRFGETDWRRLARAHPDIVVEALGVRLASQTESDPRLLAHLNAVLPQLSETRPDAALELTRQALRFEPPSRLSLQRLVERCPNEIADLALATEDSLGVSLGAVAYRLSEARLFALLESRPALLEPLRDKLHRFAPALRAKIYAVVGSGWRNKYGAVNHNVIAMLPGALRESEARRHLALPYLQVPGAERFIYATFLPWDEARALLDPYIKNPDADLRIAALSALIGSARYDRDRLGDVLALVRARNNEQDPVRCALLGALAALPPSRWEPYHLGDLGQIVRDALDASDLSYATAGYAEQIIVALVPFHPEWAATWLMTLAKERGQVSFYGLQDRLSDDDVRRIAPALLPVLTAWRTNERQQSLLTAARALARRFSVFEEFGVLLEGVVKTSKQSYIVSSLLSILCEHQNERFARLVPQLLLADKSVVTLPVVYEYLHRKRQDLITPFLGQQAYEGRFSTGRTRFVLPLLQGFERWTATQQGIFARTLEQLTRDTARDTPAISQVITQLSALPAVPPTRLFELAAGTGAKTAVRDLALQALARLDGGQGIPVLMDALGDDRARIAIYALRTAILEMPAERALALLQNAPTQKVTVAKEVVRLLGDLRTPRSLPVLLAMAENPLHRDVRVALLRALWEHVEQDETWDVLNAAATDPDAPIARGVVRIPVDRLSEASATRLRRLLATLLEHPDVQVRLDALSRCSGLPVADPDRVLLPPLLARLRSPQSQEIGIAAQAIFSTYGARDADAIAEAVGGIRENRRTLSTVLTVMQINIAGNRRLLRGTTRALLEVLATDPLTSRVCAELAVAGLAGTELAEFLVALAQSGGLHAEALMAAVTAIETAARFTHTEARAAETLLGNADDSNLRRLSLAFLLAQAQTTGGWTEERRARLTAYGNDPAPLVAAAAQFTEVPEEQAVGS